MKYSKWLNTAFFPPILALAHTVTVEKTYKSLECVSFFFFFFFVNCVIVSIGWYNGVKNDVSR